MQLLGEDGSGGTGGGLTFSPGTSVLAAPSGGRQAGGDTVESPPQDLLLPARGPQGTAQALLVFCHSMREMPSLCCREPSPFLRRQENKCIR